MTNFMIADDFLWNKLDKTFGRAAGVYKLRSLMLAPDDDRYLAINRIAGTDKDGILYIGAAADIVFRLATVKKSISAAFGIAYKDAGAHSIGKCFCKYAVLREQFPFPTLCVTVELVNKTPDELTDHYALENHAIDLYASKFGEAPPLNSMGRAGVV